MTYSSSSPVVTTTPSSFASTNTGSPGKWPLKRRKRERERRSYGSVDIALIFHDVCMRVGVWVCLRVC